MTKQKNVDNIEKEIDKKFKQIMRKLDLLEQMVVKTLIRQVVCNRRWKLYYSSRNN